MVIRSSKLKTDEAHFLRCLTQEVLAQNGTQVLWRHPFADKKEGLLCSSVQQMPLSSLDPARKCFVVKDFADMPDPTCVCLKPALYFSLAQQQLCYEKCSRGKVAGHLLFEKGRLGAKKSCIHLPSQYLLAPTFASTRQKAYMHAVEQALDNMRHGPMKKVVLARHKYVPYKEHCPVELFLRLCALYPMSFVYLLCCPKTGIWIGASPEILLQHSPTHAHTHALAGTQKIPRSGSLYSLTWSAKEKKEQSIVRQWIKQQLQALQLEKVKESARENIRVGDMAHIRSTFSIPIDETSPPLGAMLSALHPTPAICGFPMQAARAFIQSHEHTHRRLYSGFLGPVGFGSASHVYVNIRCACFMHGSVCLYAGAGIVHGSDPYKEWLETEIKCTTLQKVLS